MKYVIFESIQSVKDLGVIIASNSKLIQQCKDAVGKTNRMLGFINRNFSFKNKEVILPLFGQCHLECDANLVISPYKGHNKIRCPTQGIQDNPVLT